jgi:hypothetical protein
MDRSLWLSLMAVGLSLAVLFTVRAVLDAERAVHAADIKARIEALDGGPSTEALAEEVNEAAGCIYGNRPEIRTCWYVWQAPTRADYQLVVAERVLADSTSSAVSWALGSLPFWLLAGFSGWKATRPRQKFRPSTTPVPGRPRPTGRPVP